MKDIRATIQTVCKRNILIIIMIILLCPILAVSYATFITNTAHYKASEMYIGKLLYSILINNDPTLLNSIEVEPGYTEVLVSVTSLNSVSTNYKLVYETNPNISVVYAEDENEPARGLISTTNNSSLLIRNTSSSNITVTFRVAGGYSTNELAEISLPQNHSEIATEYTKFDYNTVSMYLNGRPATEISPDYSYTLDSYNCTDEKIPVWNSETHELLIPSMNSQTKCSLYFLGPEFYYIDGTLRVFFPTGSAISLSNPNPGNSTAKTFSVTNEGLSDSYYKINWYDFNNTITKDELAVSFICTSYSTYLGVGNAGNVISGKCDNMTEEAAYDRDLKTSIKIPSGYTYVYNMTTKFLNINVNQDYNDGKSFTGILQVEEDSPSWVESCIGNNSLRCRIITDNIPTGQTEVPRDDSSSTYVTASSGINFAASSTPTNGQGLYRNTQIGDGNNYYFRGGNFCAYTNYLTEDMSGTKCTAAGGTWTNYKCSLDYNQTLCQSKGFTYYRLNNNVSFAGYMWKIIRIDEEGNVKLLYNGTSTTSRGETAQIGRAKYNSKWIDNSYVGYMQPDNQPATDIAFTTTKEQAESNDINSPLKTLVDNWYRDYIDNQPSTVTSKIATTSGYCNDRRTVTVNGGFDNNAGKFAPHYRLGTTYTPSYKCSHESNDLFTKSGTTKGNKKLTYPVGLITADELSYAGVIGSYNFRVYASSGSSYWTLSPSFYLPAGVGSVSLSNYSRFSNDGIANTYGARPLVSLTSTATVNANTLIGGDGSLEHPYIIE